MDETYDFVILGTGLTECILSGILSVAGKSVLHVDRNDYYGGDCASLNSDQLVKHFKFDGDLKMFGKSKDWNVDLVPKFIICQGKMIKILLHCGVDRYLEFKGVDGSYVFQKKKIHKVPSNETEALKSSLLGMFEKYRFKDFLIFIGNFDEKNPSTYKNFDLNKQTAREVMNYYKLDKETINFVGHANALYREDDYLDKPALEFVKRTKLYFDSLAQAVGAYHGSSPYLYPLYGLGDLPQAFARLASINGGTYMLNKPFDGVRTDESGGVTGFISEGETATCTTIIAPPSYFPDKVKVYGKMVRSICILDHPISNSNNADSAQIILPQSQCNRKSDIYINLISHAHCVCPKGKYVAIISTTVETDDPESELKPAFQILGPVMVSWTSVLDMHEPCNDAKKEHIYITKSYDATPHFETVIDDVLRIYKEVTGEDFDFSRPISRDE